MTASLQLQIRDAVAALLAGLAVDGGVETNRDLVLATGVMSQVHVSLRSSEAIDAEVYTGAPRDWATSIEVVILTRKNAGVEASDAADALWAAAYQAVMADQTLGGLAWELLPGRSDIEDAETDTSVCRLTWTLTVHHRTSNNVLTS